MFRSLGQMISRFPLFFLAAWLLLLVGGWLAAPPWNAVAEDKEFAFLPANVPSRRGEDLLRQAFPDDRLASTVVLVVQRTGGASDLERDKKFIEDVLEPGLRQIADDEGGLAAADTDEPLFADEGMPAQPRRSIIARIRTPNAPGAGAVTDLGERAAVGTRLDLVLRQSPFARDSIDALSRIEQAVRDALPPDVRAEAQISVAGTTASARDLQNVVQADRQRIQLLVLASVFVVLVLLLRRVGLSLYLLVSVLFSYFTTLGVAMAVFWILDPVGYAGLDWKVAIFLFTILVAVGEDYNIFLLARITEEQQRHGSVKGIVKALTRTGPIISACGIIMAGTFSTLMAGSLLEMKQLGFALAFGILLDTFVVRPILVPAFLIWIHRGRIPSATEPRGERSTATPHWQLSGR
jgi:uncharacterized membrane protein YdfJ with MMPL/SSD domain